MNFRGLLKPAWVCGLLAASYVIFAHYSLGQALYSYLDENGIQVFTNIPPVNAVWNLKVTPSFKSPAIDGDDNVRGDPSRQFDQLIQKYAAEYQLDPTLIRSIIAAESGFNPNAVSPKGAQGLMQLMPETASRLGVVDAFDPEQNIRAGTRYLRWLLDIFDNNLHLSLAAYNAGENLVQRLGRIPEIRETREYIRKVIDNYSKKEAGSVARERPNYSATYRFVDETGVLHLTNIPPSR